MATPDPQVERVGTVRWATFAGVCVLALLWSAYSVGAQTGSFLTQDFGAQYHLAKLTAHGAIPLVDFEHGWNAGSFWINAVLYAVASGSPTVWYFLWGRLLGAGLGAVLAAAIGLRLRLHPAVMIAVALGVLLLATPLHIKYSICLLWVFVLLPTGWFESRPRLAALARILLPALVFWQYVELAVLLLRRGRVVTVRTFALRDVRLPDDELLSSFVSEYYGRSSFVPDESPVPTLA